MQDEKDKKENNENLQNSLPETEDEVVEFEYNEDGEEDLKKTLKKLRVELKQAKKEKEEYLTGWQKERADFANYKKQEEDRKAMISESLRERILSRFLTVSDSFNMAFANREAWEKVDVGWRTGVEYIYSQMQNVFEEYGVKSFGEVEDTFDPNLHEPVEMIETDQKENDHKVAQVIQKGYKLGDPRQGGAGRVIRAARVNLFEYKAKE